MSQPWHDSFICVTLLVHMCEMIRLPWLIHMCDVTHLCVDHVSTVTWLVSTWDVTHSCVWLIHMCDMTRQYVRCDSLICVTWLIHMCDMTRLYGRHDSSIYVTWLIHMCDMTPSHTSCDTHRYHLRNNLINAYGVATIGRLLKNKGLFCKRAL